ncbi:unnamed protein product [Rangifer tarandus platyrhynchus]|uniref:Uncharacterized protein n=1 Tax=Rangifer tarandus platyrhynchus TaxID=3082113 RepID=A0AC60A5I7_RANTA
MCGVVVWFYVSSLSSPAPSYLFSVVFFLCSQLLLGECFLSYSSPAPPPRPRPKKANHYLKNPIVSIFQKAFRTINVMFIGTWRYLYNCTENNLLSFVFWSRRKNSYFKNIPCYI